MILTTVMAHQRKLIRTAVAAMLVAANTAAGARVKTTRIEPNKKTQLPSLSVYTLSEETDMSLSAASAPREVTRHLELEIAAWVAHSDSYPVDDAMDDVAEQIEAVMDADTYLRSTVADSILMSCKMQVVEDDGRSDPLIGILVLTYLVTYRTDVGATATDDFVTVDAQHQVVGGVPSTVPAEDTFTLETP